MDSDAGGWLWLVIDLILVGALALGLIYGTMMWRSRRQNRALDAVSERATERLYEREADREQKQEAANDRKSAPDQAGVVNRHIP
jgi:Flp pilus assembly protein TadB